MKKGSAAATSVRPVCGEKRPPTEYCQICAPETVKGVMIDYILQAPYGDADYCANMSPSHAFGILEACAKILDLDKALCISFKSKCPNRREQGKRRREAQRCAFSPAV